MSDARVDAEVGAIDLDVEQPRPAAPVTSETTAPAAAKDEADKEGGGE